MPGKDFINDISSDSSNRSRKRKIPLKKLPQESEKYLKSKQDLSISLSGEEELEPFVSDVSLQRKRKNTQIKEELYNQANQQYDDDQDQEAEEEEQLVDLSNQSDDKKSETEFNHQEEDQDVDDDEEESEYEYVIDGGFDNPKQEFYLDTRFPEYMMNLLKTPILSCYINKSRKDGSFARKFGKWDKRFMKFNMELLELLYSKHPDDKTQNQIPLQKVLRIRQDSGFSKKGKCVIVYCTTRVFHFQFENMLFLNKFLLLMGYIRHKRDHIPLYVHGNPTVFKGKHGNMEESQTKELDKKCSDLMEKENLFLTIQDNQLCFKSKKQIKESLILNRNKGAIVKNTKVVAVNGKKPLNKSNKVIPPPLPTSQSQVVTNGQSNQNLEKSSIAKKEPLQDLGEPVNELDKMLTEAKMSNKNGLAEKPLKPEKISSRDNQESLELKKLQAKVEALEREKKEFLKLQRKNEKKKEEDSKKIRKLKEFEKQQTRRKKDMIEQLPDKSGSEDEDSDELQELQRLRRKSTDIERDNFMGNRNKTVQPKRKKPRQQSDIIIQDVDMSDQEELVQPKIKEKVIKPQTRGNFFEMNQIEKNNAPMILPMRANQRKNSRQIRRGSNLTHDLLPSSGLFFDQGLKQSTLITEVKSPKKKKIILKKKKDGLNIKETDIIEIIDQEQIIRQNQLKESYLVKLKKQNKGLEEELLPKKKKTKKTSQQQVDQIMGDFGVIDIENFNTKQAAKVAKRQRQEQEQRMIDIYDESLNHKYDSDPNNLRQDVNMTNSLKPKTLKKKPIKPVLNFSNLLIGNQVQTPMNMTQSVAGVNNFMKSDQDIWDNMPIKKKKSVRTANQNIIEIQGFEGENDLAISKITNPVEKDKKKTQVKKKRTKSKDNIFSTNQSHNRQNIEHVDNMYASYNPSIGQKTFGGGYSSQLQLDDIFQQGIFGSQQDPTIVSNYAIMDTKDGFVPRQNSGALIAQQMHKNLALSTYDGNHLAEKPKKKKKKAAKKKKGILGLDHQNETEVFTNLGLSQEFKTELYDRRNIVKESLLKKPKFSKLNMMSDRSNNSWDEEF